MIIEKMAADKKPFASNPSIILDTNKTINTDIIKDINPKVKKLMGKVSILKIKPIVEFAKAMRMAAMMDDPNPLISIPGTR